MNHARYFFRAPGAGSESNPQGVGRTGIVWMREELAPFRFAPGRANRSRLTCPLLS